MTDYSAVLTLRHAGREWVLDGDDYAGLVMLVATNQRKNRWMTLGLTCKPK